MYQIIGADGRVYGPVSSEQTRRWMAEGRVNAQTRVQEAGATEWKTAAEFPELGLAPAAGLPEPGQEREANFMSDSIRELVQKGRLRERCAEPVQWTCAVCGTDTADNTQPCGVCCGTEFKPRCVRCDAVGVPGGERACESVAQYRLTGRMAFNDEPAPPPHPGNLWKCPEGGTPTAAPGAAGAECPACLKTVRPLQANASPPPPPIGANLIWGMIDQCD